MEQHSLPLLLTAKPSLRLKYIRQALYLFALIACLDNSLPESYRIILLLLIVTNYFFMINRHKDQQCVIQYDDVNGWQIKIDNQLLSVKILPSTLINNYALFLHLEIVENSTHIQSIVDSLLGRNKKSIVIMSDSLSNDDYRQLIVKLKTTWANLIIDNSK